MSEMSNSTSNSTGTAASSAVSSAAIPGAEVEALSERSVANLLRLAELCPGVGVGTAVLSPHPKVPGKRYKQYYGLYEPPSRLVRPSVRKVYGRGQVVMETTLFVYTGRTHVLFDLDVYDDEEYVFLGETRRGAALKAHLLERFLHDRCFAVPSVSGGLHLYLAVPPSSAPYRTAIGCPVVTRAADGAPAADLMCAPTHFGGVPYRDATLEAIRFHDPRGSSRDPRCRTSDLYPLVQHYIEPLPARRPADFQDDDLATPAAE